MFNENECMNDLKNVFLSLSFEAIVKKGAKCVAIYYFIS